MTCRVHKEFALWIRGFDLGDVARGNVLIKLSKVIHHPTLRALVEFLRGAAAVVGNCASDGQLAGGHIRDRSAPAIADDPHAAGVSHDRDRGGQVSDELFAPQLFDVATTFLHVAVRVSELYSTTHAVE